MATYYIDFEGGNDANAGTSFATRWKTFTNGATAARIAEGDFIRVMASPDPTLLGNATWTNGPRPATVTVTSSTNASPIVITTTTPHGLLADDYVAISGHNTNTNANGVWKVGTVGSANTFEIRKIDGSNTTGNGVGSGGTSQKATNCIVKLASPVTQNIAACGGQAEKPAWIASPNVTTGKSTTLYKEGYTSILIAPTATFTTGKAAYYTLPSALDLSSYEQVSFWIQQTVGTVNAAGAMYLALCSDTLGNTVVNTINIPFLGAAVAWVPVTVNTGGPLGSNIQSIALYIVTDNGAQTFVIDNIFACKAANSPDSLNLTSLISKSNGTGDESWYAIQSINGDAIMIANGNNLLSNANNLRGYSGVKETAPTYKRETIKLGPTTTFTATVNAINDGGQPNNPITYSGGWNRTDMSTQTGETWYDGINGYGYCYSILGSYNRLDKLNSVRFNFGYSAVNQAYAGNSIGTARFVSNNNGMGFQWNNVFDIIYCNNNQSSNITMSGGGNYIGEIKTLSNSGNTCLIITGNSNYIQTIVAAHNNNNNGVQFGTSAGNFIGSLTADGNTNWAVTNTSGYDNVIGSGTTTNNVIGGANNGSGKLYLNNFVINEASEVTNNGNFNLGFTYINRLDNTDGNNWIFTTQATINQQTAIVDSPATAAWKITHNVDTDYYSEYAPLKFKLGTIVCAANSLVTITARMRRESTDMTVQLVCPAGQISGVPSRVSSNMTAAPNTWETVTITFTPTKAGGVDIYAHSYGNSGSVYVCNLTASQA